MLFRGINNLDFLFIVLKRALLMLLIKAPKLANFYDNTKSTKSVHQLCLVQLNL